MIDTISLHTNNKRVIEAVRSSISKDNLNEYDVHSFSGNIENMQVKGNINGVSITGSIATFLNKQNVTPLTRESYKQALQKLENTVGYNFLNYCIVRRVDVGYSFIVDNPVSEYLHQFDDFKDSRFDCNRHSNGGILETITYKTDSGNTAFCAYDKVKECEKHKIEIPELYKCSKILRMEYRIGTKKQQGVKRIFGVDIKPYQIAESATYRRLVELFSEFYFNIHKSGRVFCVNGIKDNSLTTKAFFDLLADYVIQYLPDNYKRIKGILIDSGKLKQSSDTLKDIRKREKSCRENFLYADTNDLIQELDEKVRLQVLQGK